MAGTLVLSLAGCASGTIEKNLQPMVGRPASGVFEKLGLPDSEGEVAGRKFYLWGMQASGSYMVPTYDMGTIHGANGLSTYRFLGFRQQSYDHVCTVRVFVDSRDLVTTYDFKGNEGGCANLARQLGR